MISDGKRYQRLRLYGGYAAHSGTLHNVPQEKVSRPHARAGFGAQNARAAVFAVCKFYGLLHR